MAPFEFELGFDDVAPATPTRRRTKAPRALGHVSAEKQASSINPLGGVAADNGKTEAKVEPQTSPVPVTPPSHGKKRPYSSTVGPEHQPELSVGLDFGMVFSGISKVSTSAGPFAVEVMKQWPGTVEFRDKVPSLLALNDENPQNEGVKVGYEVSPTMNGRGYLKYAMDKNAPATKYDDPILSTAAGRLMLRTTSGENTVEHAVEYLRVLYKLFWEKLEHNAKEAFISRLRILWTVTHPVACSEEGKRQTLDAMKAVGIGTRKHDKVRLVSEAEAAIIAAFAYAQGAFGPNTFGVKTNVTMIDIGGLTIDSATFYIKVGDPNLKLDQVCVSEGGKSGGITIFCRFYHHCTKWFGPVFTELRGDQIGSGSKFVKDFESEIRRFDGKNPDKYLRLPLAMDIEYQKNEHYRMGEVVFDGHVMQACIDPLLEYSRKILSEQFTNAKAGNSKKISTVVLGGGLALCPYIEEKLREFCEHFSDGNIQLVRPDAAWSLVSRGAAIRGLKTNIVEGRKSRAWYGIAGHRKLDEDEDEEDADFDDPINGPRISGAMKWHVKKSERITADTKPKAVKAYIVLSQEQMENLEDLSGIIPLYEYAGDDENAPATVNHPEVKKIGTIVIDLSEMSPYARKATMKAYEESDDADQKLRLSIEQNVNASSGLIEFTAKVGMTRIGKYALRHGAVVNRSGI